MAIIPLEDLKARLGVTTTNDDAFITDLIDEAQSFLEGQIGAVINEASPLDLRQAVSAVAAHWFENREASLVGLSAMPLPLGVEDIIRNRRNYDGWAALLVGV